MKYYTVPPSPTLKNFIRFFWVLESTGAAYIHRSVADVCPEMVFHYNGCFDEIKGDLIEPSCISALQGPSTGIRRFSINKAFGIFGVYLYPYSIPFLFGMPTAELQNEITSLVSLLGREGVELEERIVLATDNNERIKIATRFFEQRLLKIQQHRPAILPCIHHVIHSRGILKVEELAKKYFISQRQFERKFKEFSGFSPKLFTRIVRFHSACQQFGNAYKSLTDLAYDCGYYDQSHFIHDFKEFSGHHPKHYFSGKAEGTEWKSN